MSTPPIYGTVYIRPASIEPRCAVMGDGNILVTFEATGHHVYPAFNGTQSEIVDFCQRVIEAVNATEPAPHPQVTVVSHRFGTHFTPTHQSYCDEMDAAGDHQHRDVEGF